MYAKVRDGNGRVYPEDPETGMRVIPGDERQLTVISFLHWNRFL